MTGDEFAAAMRNLQGYVERLEEHLDRCEETGPAREATSLRAVSTLEKIRRGLEALEVSVFTGGGLGRIQESVARVTTFGEIIGEKRSV